MAESDCLFCRMASGAIPVDKLHEDEDAFVIADINPRAPVHLLVIPREHIPSARDLQAGHAVLLAHLLEVANQAAGAKGIADRGYRLAVNVGEEGGQSVPHLHIHVLGGRRLGAEG